jgi:HAMP domain-containing protein
MYDGRPEATAIEKGMWRARLQDMLDSRPDLAQPVKRMVDDLRREVFPTA